VAGAVYQLINHALFKSLLFISVGSILHATGIENLSELGGLARRRPVATIGFIVGSLAIAGVPPLNGYASLGIIHDALRESDPTAYATLLVAQVITVAALTRAAYLAFFRRREDGYEELDRLHPGMITAFVTLIVGCIAFGVFPGFVLGHVVNPAAGALTSGAPAYAADVLGGSGTVGRAHASFDYWSVSELATVLGTVLIGAALAWWYVRREEPHAMTLVRRIQSGSVNDYAAYAAFGLVVLVGSLCF
jgi:multicomponent Na+:H+ antiporter subunit D